MDAESNDLDLRLLVIFVAIIIITGDVRLVSIQHCRRHRQSDDRIGFGIGTDGGCLTKRECRHPRLSRKGGDIDASSVVAGSCCDVGLVHRLGYRGRGWDGESLSSRSTLFLGFFWEMFSIERVSYAERNCKIVIFKRVLRLNVNEINR